MTPPTAWQWLSLAGIIWLQSVNGTNTNFPAYSSQLKQLLSLSQLQLNNLAFASDAGKLFGFFSGIAAFYLPLWLVLLIGSTLGLIGYGVQYLFITNYISSLSYTHIFLLTVVAGNSICWINTVCYVVTIRNFPSDRQVAVGLSTSYQGLSAKIYTVIVDALFVSFPEKKAKAYLLFNHLTISATGIYAVITSLRSMPSGLPPFGNAIGVLVFLLAPLVIPLAVKIREILAAKSWINREAKVYNFTVEENVNVERMGMG
ncbi:hypothetical protein GH714_010884 [Hevea brasiliensis]|uniref:Nodulin-like domain-containing protein n=1 Tax=Hevea brasiliensis TaxID=3981 RepID=A0A6A6LB86_HEVBR|nr:hypothetical protein GH714_010884 [Hevea brasiliensis]